MFRRCVHSGLSTLLLAGGVLAQDGAALPTTTNRPRHGASAREHDGAPPPEIETAPLPQGLTLEEVLDRAANPPPADWPKTVPDGRVRAFTLIEQLEYRISTDEVPDHLGWEAQGWIGGDFNKFWWKSEGEAVFDGSIEGESENDFLYSRLFTPFWSFQLGAQYANEWTEQDYSDRWSGVVALQGLAPYKFELDTSLYISDRGDVTAAIEAEYDIRITQRLVLQPRTELGFAAQDIPERLIGAGMTGADLDLRLRYEIKREFAPYLGIRQQFLVGETRDMVANAGGEVQPFYVLVGLRFAF